MKYFKKSFLIKLICLTLFHVTSAQPPGSAGNWNLVFEDNFNGTTLDQKKWGYNYPWGHTHNHRAYMTDSMVTVQNGYLTIKAINKRHPDAPAGTNQYESSFGYLSFDYTSGAVHSKGKFETTYGYIEGRFKISSTQGTWPAFWTLNTDGAWPPEIDILEVPDDRKVHHYYYHYGSDWQHESSFGSMHSGLDKSQDFHTYGVEWGPSYMKFYFDGKLLNSYTNRPEAAQGKNMYLLINLAVDGWAPTPPANAVWPAIYQCDWVRVWKANESSNFDFETGTLAPWGPWNNATITSDCKRSGNYGLKLAGSPVSVERTVTLEPNTKYVFGGYGKVNTLGEAAMFGVKNYGGSQIVKTITSTYFTKDSVVFTTGSTNTSAIAFYYKEKGTGSACGDDFFLYKAKSNVPPAVSISSPASNSAFTAPATINIAATASDADGSISKVEFYNGTTLLGTDVSAPYSYTWSNVDAGAYTIAARATDNNGLTSVSSGKTITVTSQDVPPVVAITSPINNAAFDAPATVTLTATATDADGAISKVEFYNGSVLLGSSTISPYTYSWSNVSAGTYLLTVKAISNNGVATTSSTITITINSVTVPAGDIIGPECGGINSNLSYEVNPAKRTGAASYFWWYNGSAQSVTQVNSMPYKASLQTGRYFTSGQICVGVTYSIAPYHATICKTINACSSGSAAMSSEGINIAPNPTDGAFTLIALEEIRSIKVVNVNGVTVYSHGSLPTGASVQYGQSFYSGIYTLTVTYSTGKTEIKRIQKL